MRVRGGVSDIHLQADRSMRCGDWRRADTVCHKKILSELDNLFYKRNVQIGIRIVECKHNLTQTSIPTIT